MTTKHPPLETVRAWFPALARGFGFMDNAGGSQVPYVVADAVREYMLNSYAQTGAEYPASKRAGQTVAHAHDFIATVMGAGDAGKVILGSSTSALLRMLSHAYADALKPGDEVVVGTSGHESNVSPWLLLEKRGITVRRWEPSRDTGACELGALKDLLSSRTKLVAMVHVSNILGGVEDLKPCIAAAHAAGARVVVDGVAYAPHLAMDVARLGADWYVFSTYKVFGPHMAALYGRTECFDELPPPNHPWVKDFPYKFELGGALHEGCAGLVALEGYFNFLAGKPEGAPFDRASVTGAFDAMAALEDPLVERFLSFLDTKPLVRLLGPKSHRVATLAFTHPRWAPQELARRMIDANLGIKAGHFHSRRLLERLGVDPDTGVVRVSFAHYNSPAEVDRLIGALDPLL